MRSSKSWIQSASNTKIDFENPDPNSFTIEDIALGLSRQPRYAGQGKYFYSVAQHCVYAAAIADDPNIRLYALLHDAHEAYTGDIPGPLKNILGQGVVEVERRLQLAIYVGLGIKPPTKKQMAEVYKIDVSLLEPESKALYEPNMWRPEGIEPADIVIKEWDTEVARDMFLIYYHSIGERHPDLFVDHKDYQRVRLLLEIYKEIHDGQGIRA